FAAEPDRFRENCRAAIRQLITVHARDDDVLQLELADGFGHSPRLIPVQFCGHAVRDRAVLARPRTHIAQDQEGRRAGFPALADIWTAGLLAYRMQPLPAH